jgi:hypothetical protein
VTDDTGSPHWITSASAASVTLKHTNIPEDPTKADYDALVDSLAQAKQDLADKTNEMLEVELVNT